MESPSNVPFGLRAIEWMRDNGAAWLVSDIERYYYSWSAPSTGGPALRRLPKVGVARALAWLSTYQPPSIAPAINPPLPGRGPMARNRTRSCAARRRCWSRPSDRIRTTRRWSPGWHGSIRRGRGLQLYPGRYEPPNSGNAVAEVPPQLRAGLLATFNSGFKLEDDGGGFVAFGHVYAPLRDGQATLIRYRDGTVDVVSWNGGPVSRPERRVRAPEPAADRRRRPPQPQHSRRLAMGRDARQRGPGVALGRRSRRARQHRLRGRRQPDRAEPGADPAASGRRPRDGARHQLRVGDASTSTATWGASGAQKLLPDMKRDATRYLTPDDRDFVAVYARRG